VFKSLCFIYDKYMQTIDLFVLYPVFFLIFSLVCLCNIAESPLPPALKIAPRKEKEEVTPQGWRVSFFFR